MMTYVNIKNVIVVDEDVDIYDPADVMWAVSNRVVPERDILYVPNAQGHEADPAPMSGAYRPRWALTPRWTARAAVGAGGAIPKVDLNLYP